MFNACTDNADDYNMKKPKTFEESKEMIKSIFKAEKGVEIARLGLRQAFHDWLMGLCFCSPIMENLTPFTRYKNNISQENDVADKIYQIIFYGL